MIFFIHIIQIRVHRLPTACHEGNVTAISTDPPYSVIGRPIPAGIAPFLIAYDPLHHRMYVTNLGSDTVYVIDVK